MVSVGVAADIRGASDPTHPGDTNKSSGVQENKRVTYW
jgi:hypothetical protein